ncbi:MAG: hypothetical protein WA755_00230 [Candidatus Acidiferrales bacterium]
MSAAKKTPEAQEGVDTFRLKLSELSTLLNKNPNDAVFDRWRMTTLEALKHYVRGTQYYFHFLNIDFKHVGYWDSRRDPFVEGCKQAQTCLEGAIEHIERFGLEKSEEKPEVHEAGTSVHFHGTIQNLAIAMDSATQIRTVKP